MSSEFLSPRKTSQGYTIKLKKPIVIQTPILSNACPFGIDQETIWKWSIKINFDPSKPNEEKWINCIEEFDRQVNYQIQNVWFPTTWQDYFHMKGIMENKGGSYVVGGTQFHMRGNIAVKSDTTKTHFTGNEANETQRMLTLYDSNAISDKGAQMRFTLKCDAVRVMEKSKTIGCTWCVEEIVLL